MPSCGSNFQVAHNVILNSIEGLAVGNNVYLAMGNIIYAHGKAIIGNNVMFGPDCLLTTGNLIINGMSGKKNSTVLTNQEYNNSKRCFIQSLSCHIGDLICFYLLYPKKHTISSFYLYHQFLEYRLMQ